LFASFPITKWGRAPGKNRLQGSLDLWGQTIGFTDFVSLSESERFVMNSPQSSKWLFAGVLVLTGTHAGRARAEPPRSPVPDLGTRKSGSDWPRFLGPLGTGVSPEKGIIAPWPKTGLRLVWHSTVGTGYCMPAVSRGRLFLFDRVKDRARLRCMKSETGDMLWTFDYTTEYVDFYGYNNGPRASPVVDDDRVYIYGPEGMLYCLLVADGTVVWKVDTKAGFGFIQNFFGVASTPAIEGNLLIAVVGGSPPGSQDVPFIDLKGNGSGIVAFDKFTGEVKYKLTDELASYASPVLATIGGRRWCFVFARFGLVGFEPASGKLDFQFPWKARAVESVNAANPVVVDDKVFISETYGPGSALLKVKPGNCDVLWTDAEKRFDKSMQAHWGTPIYHEGYLYGASGRHSQNADLRCIELATGKVMWTVPGMTRMSLLMVDGYFVGLSEELQLVLIKVKPKACEMVSEMELRPEDESKLPVVLRPPCWAAPILSHGLLYVRGGNELVCFELIPEKP
jgi:outer membrane protein assembly factor BamB